MKKIKLPINYDGRTRTEHIEQLTKKQDGLCGICVGNFNYKRKRVIDHDHKTGQIRGLLCYKCNTGLGFFNDEVDLLERAIHYIMRADPSKPLDKMFPIPERPKTNPIRIPYPNPFMKHWWEALPEIWEVDILL